MSLVVSKNYNKKIMEVVQCVNEPKICFSHAYHIVRGGLRRRSCHLHHVCLHVVAFFSTHQSLFISSSTATTKMLEFNDAFCAAYEVLQVNPRPASSVNQSCAHTLGFVWSALMIIFKLFKDIT